MTSNYVPTRGTDDWRWLLADPGLHWKQGASAKSLADAWEQAEGWPAAVAPVLKTSDRFDGLTPLVGIPEHETPLAGGRRASQTDLLVLARDRSNGLVVIAVEGKARETFGQALKTWRAQGGGRRKRIEYVLGTLELGDGAHLDGIRYQLLHRAAAAVIEAHRFGAADAVLLVHSFHAPGSEGQPNAWLDDFQRFAELFGASARAGEVVEAGIRGGVRLHLGWVSDTPLAATEPDGLGPRFDRAVMLARGLHARQPRKGTSIPYLAHLLGVASLVLEDGGDEDEAIAALLHDAVEDQGGAATLGLIKRTFGARVASIVQACSDTDEDPKPPWRERKEAYVAHLRDPNLPGGTLRVSLADKLHNARAILFDLRAGEDVFARFSAGRSDQHWYYSTLADTFAELIPSPMVTALRQTVTETYG